MESLLGSRLAAAGLVDPADQGKDMLMANLGNGPEAKYEPQLQAAGQALRASQGAERARRQAKAAQRSAARSLEKSADSQDQTAKAYEEAAEYSVRRRNEFLEAAARHRGFAQEDRRMAQELRQMADSD